jgi:hypothetical protein
MRYKLNLGVSQVEKKWNRQGIPEVVCIFQTHDDFNNKRGYKMNQLPDEILKFNRSTHSYMKTLEFLKGVGSCGDFLTRFHRQQSTPAGFDPVIHGLTEGTRGWKMFNRTRSMSGKCIGGKRQQCCQEYVDRLQGIAFQSPIHSAIAIVNLLPTRLDMDANLDLRIHYQPFINFVQMNSNLMFLPEKDALLD